MNDDITDVEPKHTGLDQLAGMAAGVDADLTPPTIGPDGKPVQPEEPQDVAKEVAGMLMMAVAMLLPAMPFLSSIYTPECCHMQGVAVAAVAKKHNWDLSTVMTPEVALAMAVLPPLVQAVLMARKHFAELQRLHEAGTSSKDGQAPAHAQAGTRVVSSGG